MKLLLKLEFQSRELKTWKWTILKTVVEVAFYYKTLLNLATEVLKSNSPKCKKVLLHIVTDQSLCRDLIEAYIRTFKMSSKIYLFQVHISLSVAEREYENFHLQEVLVSGQAN